MIGMLHSHPVNSPLWCSVHACAQEVAGESLDDLFLSERQEQLRAAQEDKMTRFAQIPGMLNPQQMDQMAGDLGDEAEDM